jgi:hypothetical protein
MHFLTQSTVVKFFVEGLWRDEAFSWAMATNGLGVLPLTARDFNPPLYYLLLYGWMQLTGSSEVAMRSLSLLFFTATLWVVWRFMVDLLGIARGWASAYVLLFALNPMLSYYAVEARMYSLLALLAAVSFYAYLARRPVLYVVGTTAGLYTHYFMLLVVACQLIAALSSAAGRADLRRRSVAFSAPLLLLAPWLCTTIALKDDYGGVFWIEHPGWKFSAHLVTSIFTGYDAVYGFLDRAERWRFAACLLPLLGWSLWAGSQWRERRPVVVQTIVWALVPAVLVFTLGFVKPLFVPRYLIFSTTGLLMLFIIGIDRTNPAVRVAVLCILSALSLHYQVLQAQRHSKGGFRETIRAAASEAQPEDVLLVRHESDFFPAQYYFGESRVFVYGRRYEAIPAFQGKVLIPRDKVILTPPATSGRVFVLNGDRVSTLQTAPAAATMRVGQH